MLKITTMKDSPHVFIVVDENNIIKKYAYSEKEAQKWIDSNKG